MKHSDADNKKMVEAPGAKSNLRPIRGMESAE